MLHLDEHELASLKQRIFLDNVAPMGVEEERFVRLFDAIYRSVQRVGFVREQVRVSLVEDASHELLDAVLDIVWVPIAETAREQARLSKNIGGGVFLIFALSLAMNVAGYAGVIDALQIPKIPQIDYEWVVFIYVVGAITGGLHFLRGRHELREIEKALSIPPSGSSTVIVELTNEEVFPDGITLPELLAGLAGVTAVVVGGFLVLGAFNSGVMLFNALVSGGASIQPFSAFLLGLIALAAMNVVGMLLLGAVAVLSPVLRPGVGFETARHCLRALLFYELALGSLLAGFRFAWDADSLLLVLAISFGVPKSAAWLVRRGARYWAATRMASVQLMDQALLRDMRRPVLYLRSFQTDELPAPSVYRRPAWWESQFSLERVLSIRHWLYQRDVSFEESLCLGLGQIGPVLAIGRPGDSLPHLGASRLFVSEREWQQKVLELMDKAQLVCLVVGSSSGLLWEFSQMATGLCRNRLLLVCIPEALHVKT